MMTRNATRNNILACDYSTTKKSRSNVTSGLSAVWTGLEPATPCVTGRYSNQLNYHTIVLNAFVLDCGCKVTTYF